MAKTNLRITTVTSDLGPARESSFTNGDSGCSVKNIQSGTDPTLFRSPPALFVHALRVLITGIGYRNPRALLTLLSVVLPLLSSVGFSQSRLSVEQVVELALKNNYDIILARIDTDISRVNNSWAATGAYPTIAAGGVATGSNVSIDQKFSNGSETIQSGVSQTNIQGFVNLNWKVFDGLKMFATKSRLEEIERSGELAYRNTVSQTVFDVSMLYFAIVRLHQQAAATQSLMSVLEERLKIARVRFEVGTSARSDVLQAQIDLNDQRSSLLNINTSITQTIARLNALLGRSPGESLEVTDTIESGSPVSAQDFEQSMMNQNYSLLLSQQDLAIALQSRKEIYAQGLPGVTLNAGYNYTRSSNSAGFSLVNQSNGFNAGIGITVPLFNGFSTQTQLDVQDLRIERSRMQIENLKIHLRSIYNSALSDFENAGAVYAIESETLTFARQNADIAMERFRRQSITSVELRQIQLSVLDAETRILNTRLTAKAAELELMLLAGRLALK